VETNLVFVAFAGRRAADLSRKLAEVGVLANPEGSREDMLRFVTHLDVSRADVDDAIDRAARVLGR
jgi:threonine aldolase